MISKELIHKIRTIEIKSNKVVDEIFSGEYHANFKGKGMEFEDIREYYPGDDVRNIDWNVTARQGQTYVKQFSEERELNMFLLIDVSKSNSFGRKKDFIAEIGATLSYSANKNNDKVGLILFTDRVEKVIPSKAGKRHTLSIIETILDFKPKHDGTDIKSALSYFYNIEKKRSVVFVISDFLDDRYERELNMVARKHDLVQICITDPLERRIPKGAIYTFEDLETKKVFIVDQVQGDNNVGVDSRITSKRMICLNTDEDYVKPLKLFFHRKVRR